jgi:hypothetical protein
VPTASAYILETNFTANSAVLINSNGNAKYDKCSLIRLCGIVVSVPATEPKGRGFNPGQGDGFLRAIKIRSTPSIGREVKPEVPYRKLLKIP